MTGNITGNLTIQQYLDERYRIYHRAGYSKKDSHALAFQDAMAVQQQGYIELDSQDQPHDDVYDAAYEE